MGNYKGCLGLRPRNDNSFFNTIWIVIASEAKQTAGEKTKLKNL